jgi:hypothetical protein
VAPERWLDSRICRLKPAALGAGRARRTVSRSFRRWVVHVEDERVRQSDGSIQLTEYRDGDDTCARPAPHQQNGNLLAQLGAKSTR